MKYIIIAFFLFFTLSCSKKERVEANARSVEQKELPENAEIEIYNYDELEKVLKSEEDMLLVVNFWATWCKPCIEELPYFEAIQKKHKSSVKVILVSLDFPNKLDSQLKPFLNKKQIESQVILLDDPYENEWIPKVDTTWSGAIPATLLIYKGEKAFYERSFTQEELEYELSEFIKT
ncbi:MAG: redoxin domain-containing protein [Flavobacteriaceae bacterium]|nr:MAG: redoxin domain-containing protein [Flavobacteriaceae bacterium]